MTPATLRARREALDLTRDAVASFSPPGTTGNTIRNLERVTSFRVQKWHVDALDRLEAWFDEHAHDMIEAIHSHAIAHDIDGLPVLWHFSRANFSWCQFSKRCFGEPDLYHAIVGMVRFNLIEQSSPPRGVVDAEFSPDHYNAFRAEIGATADHPELRAKWWRHFRNVYKLEG